MQCYDNPLPVDYIVDIQPVADCPFHPVEMPALPNLGCAWNPEC
jgi:hypothetical protein